MVYAVVPVRQHDNAVEKCYRCGNANSASHDTQQKLATYEELHVFLGRKKFYEGCYHESGPWGLFILLTSSAA
jgi:hypothetical protein